MNSFHDKCNQYLLEAIPTNTAAELTEYGHDSAACYPRPANAAMTLLCLAIESCDVQSFLSAEVHPKVRQPSDGGQHVEHADDNVC